METSSNEPTKSPLKPQTKAIKGGKSISPYIAFMKFGEKPEGTGLKDAAAIWKDMPVDKRQEFIQLSEEYNRKL
jgi:hypothetical protein